MSKRTLVRQTIKITGLSPEMLSFYRAVREGGFNRHDANLMVLGVIAHGEAGIVRFTVREVL